MTQELGDLAFYKRAGLRPGVETELREQDATFRYRALSFDVDFTDATRPHLVRLCDELRRGVGMADLPAELGDFWPEACGLLDALDRYGLLTELAAPGAATTLSGEALWRDVSALAQRMNTGPDRPFGAALAEGTAEAGQLIAYAAQYFHIVCAGSRVAAAAFANAPPGPCGSILEAFLRGELGHERMLARSLAAVGLNPDSLADDNPWVETFAIISQLQVLADQEPLSFAACLFLVEEANPEFHAQFRACSERQGLPDGFWKPILAHAEINDDGDHGNISRDLLSRIEVVTQEERIVAMRQVATLVEGLIALDGALGRSVP